VSELTNTLYTKPQVGSRVDYGNPIAQRLWACYLFNEGGGKEVFDVSGMNAGVLSFTGTDPEWTQYGLAIGNGKGYVRNNKTVISAFNPIANSHTVRIVHIPRTWPNIYGTLLDVWDVINGRTLSIFAGPTNGDLSFFSVGGNGTPGTFTKDFKQNVGRVSDFVWVFERGDRTSGGSNTYKHSFYTNGELIETYTGVTEGSAWPTNVGYDFAVGADISGGPGVQYDGQMLQLQCWDRGLQPWEIQDLYSNPYALISDGPLHLFGKVPSNDATATATFGTITLTAPTATAYQNADNTASATFGTITLVAPTAEGSQSGIATATFGTITLTAPTASGISTDSTASASFGIIYLQAPTCFPYGPPFFAAMQDKYYWGRFSRGQTINIMWHPELLPDDIATMDVWLEATTIVKTITIPVLEEDDAVFGIPLLLDEDMVDGNYVAVTRFQSGTIDQCTLSYFQVIGGTGEPAIVSLLEIDRPLGRAVITQDASGEVLMGYDPRTGE